MPNLRQSTHQWAIPRSVYACCKVFQSICSVFCNFMSLLFFLSPCVSSRVLPSTCPPCFCGYEICDTAAAAPLQKLRTQKQICGEKWTGSERDWRPSWSCDAVTSTPAPLAPYQPARPPDSSDWTGSITVSGWNRLRCCFYYIRLLHSPPPSSAVSSSLAQAPAGYLFVMGFSHLSPSSSSLQPESLSAWMEASFLLAEDLWTSDTVPARACSKSRTKTASCRLFLPESRPNEPYLVQEYVPEYPELSLRCSCFFTWSLEVRGDVWLNFLPRFSYLFDLNFPLFVTLISTSANCLIKNVRTNETGAHKDQDVIKYSEACWSFIGHVMYLTELDGVGELHYRFDDFTKCVKRELNFHFQNLTHIHCDACNYTDSSPTIQS